MAALKTQETKASPSAFIARVTNPQRRADAKALLKIFTEATGLPAKMWGTSIIGFGKYHYQSDRSRQVGVWPLTGFSPRAQSLTLYIMPGFKGYKDLLKKLGSHTTSVSCLYIKRLSDVHVPTLKAIIKRSVQDMRKKHG